MSHLEAVQVQCPHCESIDIQRGTQQTGYPYWKCKTCGKQFALKANNDECIFCHGPLSEDQMICYNCERRYSKR